MARKKITALTELLFPSFEDIVPIVQIAGGPITKKIKSASLAPGYDGWRYIGNNPKYISSTSIRFENIDISIAFPIGTKIKLTQTTVKYFYVLTSVYSGGHTILTLTGGSDFTVANAEITSFYYSHGLSYGFPDVFSYLPNIIQLTGSQPSMGNATRSGYFKLDGRLVNLFVSITMGSQTTYGDGNNWYVTYPFEWKGTINIATGTPYIWDSGTRFYQVLMLTQAAGIMFPYPATSTVYVRNTYPMTWASGDRLWFSISYLLFD